MFKTLKLLVSLVYSFGDPNDQLDTFLFEHAPLMKTKFTTPPAPWTKDFEMNKLKREKVDWRQEAHSKQTPQSWEKFRAIRNKIKKTSFYKKVFQSKNKNDV